MKELILDFALVGRRESSEGLIARLLWGLSTPGSAAPTAPQVWGIRQSLEMAQGQEGANISEGRTGGAAWHGWPWDGRRKELL